MFIKLTKKYRLRRLNKDKWILLTTSSALELNETGKFIIELIDKGREVSEICEKLSQEYDISESEASSDVELFINELISYGVVEVKNAIY